jgi:hypothetical protein
MENLIYAGEQMKGFLGCLLTSGTHNFSVKNECHWLFSDVIAVAMTKFLNKEDFLNCVLVVKDKQAILKIDDGNNNKLYSQEYKWTDLKNQEIKFYAVFNERGTYTLMFPNEY